MTAARILVVEDDTELLGILLRGLTEEGFAPAGARSGAEALTQVAREPPDALVVDIGLPDADGRDLCQALRARRLAAPVLFLTARDALVDRLAGFNAGGDDYLTKPFAFAELVVRLRALLRRAGSDGTLEAGALRLDPVAHAVVSGDAVARLTPTEFRLLARLFARPGEAVRRRALVAAAWPDGARVRDNTLDAYVARLRRKLASLPDAPTIETIHGVGYALQ